MTAKKNDADDKIAALDARVTALEASAMSCDPYDFHRKTMQADAPEPVEAEVDAPEAPADDAEGAQA